MEALGKLHMTVTRAYKVCLDGWQCKHLNRVHDFTMTFLNMFGGVNDTCSKM